MDSPAQPPPLPTKPVETAFHTYVRAAGLLLPSVFFLIFSSIFLIPKLEWTWEMAGVDIYRAEWLLNASTLFPRYYPFVIGMAVLAGFSMEHFIPKFARRRSTVVSVVVIVINFAMMTTLAGIAIAALLAAPMIGKDHRAPLDANKLPKRYQKVEGSQN